MKMIVPPLSLRCRMMRRGSALRGRSAKKWAHLRIKTDGSADKARAIITN